MTQSELISWKWRETNMQRQFVKNNKTMQTKLYYGKLFVD